MADMTVAVALVGQDLASKPIKDVSASLGGLEKQAEHTGGVLGSLTGALGKVGLAGLGLKTAFDAVSGAVGLLTGPIQAASDLSESMNKVDVVFGDSAKIVQDFAKTSATALGQSKAQALEAAGGFGNLFVSMGLGRKDAANLSTQIVTLGSDLASFNNIRPEDALEKLRAGLVGEAEPLRTLGVNLNEAAVQEEALRLGLAKSKDSITDAAKIQARYSLILKQTKTAQGDFARTSTGMANAQRIISASFADLQTEIGNRLLPVIAPLVSAFAQWLPAAMDRLAPVLDRAGALFRDFASGVGMVTEMLKTRGFLETLKELGLRAVPVLLQGFQSVRDLSGRIATWLRDQVAAINWTYVWYAVKNVAQGLVAGLGSVVSAVTTWLQTQWAGIAWPEIWTSVKNVGQGLAAGIGSIVDGVTAWLTETWTGIDWKPIWKAVEGHGKALVDNLAPITADLQTWLVKQWTGIGWQAVFLAARTDTEMTDAFVDTVNRSDATKIGHALGQWFLRGVGLGFDEAAATPGPFDTGILGVMNAVGQSMQRNEWRRNQAVGRWAVDLVNAFALAVVGAPDWSTFVADLRRKIEQTITGIFPIKVGPLTIGLQGVSLDLSGIGRGTVAAGDPNAAPAASPPRPPIDSGSGGPGAGPQFARGGAFVVGGSGGTDSQMVRFRATPGERVDVRTPAQQRGGGGVAVNVVVNVGEVRDRGDADYLADVLPDALARALETARTQQGSPYAGGLVRFA